MEKAELKPGMIMQLDPSKNGGKGHFGGCLMVVTNPEPFGAVGYVKSFKGASPLFISVAFEDMEPTSGMAVFDLAAEKSDPLG